MPKVDLPEIYLEFEREIKNLSQSAVLLYRDATREDAQQAIADLKTDIDSWIVQLHNRTIACYDLENLLSARKEYIQLPKLLEIGIEASELETLKSDVLRLIAKAIMNSYLDTLFRNQNAPKHVDNLFEE